MKEIKISSFPPNKDFKNFKNITSNRQKIIDKTTNSQINNNYQMNIIANKAKPDTLQLIIKNIIDETKDIKTFYLASLNQNTLPIFKPGQYITLLFNINNMHFKRPYFLSSSPNDAINNVYRISIKRRNNGIISNHMLDNLKINDTITCLNANGEFYLSSIRDKKQIVGICHDIGICPMVSFARGIYEKNIDKLLTIFYIVKDNNSIIYKNELNELSKNPNIKVVIIDESNKEKLDISLIKSYVTSKFTVFTCGNKEFIDIVKNKLTSINLSIKDFRYEIVNAIASEDDVIDDEVIKEEVKDNIEENTQTTDEEEKNTNEANESQPIEEEKINEYNIKVFTHDNEYNIKCLENQTILSALENNNIKARSKCRNGKCGYCRTLLIWGNIKIDEELDNRRKIDIKYNYIHPCITYPTSDITIKLDI